MATTAPKRNIFRSRALQIYVQNQEKTILPRIVAPPVFLFFWILLVILTIAGLVAWLGQVPLYATGAGLIPSSSSQTADVATAIILLPNKQVQDAHIQPGMKVDVQVGTEGLPIHSNVESVSPIILSPVDVHQRYGVDVTDPSQVISVKLPGITQKQFAGTLVRAQFLVGSQRLLSLFPIFS
ncbi:hypothetical protein EPA93_08590 [Ktedonosporobacter rubrisoli]|uniref:HlyD family efflux transporter periplasmic adaptor subunit n=1 Tax=Ktedonosporobacter rubrisoli TaxID=2509675 RepID=A0A4P6JLG6_KTERU|nr:hypothetical protein [Ktedonosporobacter rubrisoli]QBD76059.1 hypothetical protein EPA93_08590 [Ktedonosporobacter rubrisoli]